MQVPDCLASNSESYRAPGEGATPLMTMSVDSRTRSGLATLVLVGLVAQNVGSAVATRLFPDVGAQGVVALRLGFAAIVFVSVCRPRVRGLSRSDWLAVCALGVSLAAMNSLIYQAIDRIPLGSAVTIEILGPLALSVATSHKAISWLWAGLALAGVVLLGAGDLHGLNSAGVAFALGAAAMWAAYILATAQTGRQFSGSDGLALAMAVGAVITVPIGIARAGEALVHPHVLAVGFSVALLSSVVPYAIEMFSLRRLPASVFGVVVALAPAVAALAGLVVLDQSLTVAAGCGIALVVAASIGAVNIRDAVSKDAASTDAASTDDVSTDDVRAAEER
jgi:inner membrane transporter RhtA